MSELASVESPSSMSVMAVYFALGWTDFTASIMSLVLQRQKGPHSQSLPQGQLGREQEGHWVDRERSAISVPEVEAERTSDVLDPKLNILKMYLNSVRCLAANLAL